MNLTEMIKNPINSLIRRMISARADKSSTERRKRRFSQHAYFPDAIFLIVGLIISLHCSILPEKVPDWTGNGHFRMLVKVPPLPLEKGQNKDEMPARCAINFAELLAVNKVSGAVDLSSLQVHQYDPASGAAKIGRAHV